MAQTSQVREFIDSFQSIFSPHIAAWLGSERARALIEEILLCSGKMASEAVLVLLYAIRDIYKNKRALQELEAADAFDDFVELHREEILEIATRRRVQSNLPERGLPILELFAQLFGESAEPRVGAIELGSSYGMIGRCLLAPEAMLRNSRRFFPTGQQLPQRYRKADGYLGVDLDPPSADWLLSCIYDPENAERIEYILGTATPGYRVLRGSALGFSLDPEVLAFADSFSRIAVITSFMLYQLPAQKGRELRAEIESFAAERGAHWINLEIDATGKPGYYLEVDGLRLMELSSDSCRSWKRVGYAPVKGGMVCV